MQLEPQRKQPVLQFRATAAGVAMVIVAALAGCDTPVSQPLAFSHETHVYNGVACTVCHLGAETGTHAGLPPVDTCVQCHEDVLYDAPEEKKIRVATEAGMDLHWLALTRLQPYVYFSHRRHVRLGGIQCERCHGDVDSWNTPPSAAPVRFTGRPGMETCISCHEAQISDARGCIRCHR